MRHLALAAALLAVPVARAHADTYFAQTFTAPTLPAGGASVLTRVTATGWLQGGVGLDLYAFDGTQFVGPSLFSQTLSVEDGFDVSPDVALLPGQLYALAFRDVIGLRHDGAFAGGTLVECDPGRPCRDLGVDARGFAVEFASPAVPSTVPEPATWALMGTGLLALGGAARRRLA